MKLVGIVQAALFAAIISVSAQFRFPFIFGVPITFQTLFIILAALYLSYPYGIKSVLLYLLIGIIGFPVFAGGGGGIAWLVGPSGGFLGGFLIAAIVLQKKRQLWLSSPFYTALSIIIAIAIIFFCGISWFAFITEKTILHSSILFLSFMPGEIVKMSLAWLFIRHEINHGHLKQFSDQKTCRHKTVNQELATGCPIYSPKQTINIKSNYNERYKK